jgi:signal transduction histidine kinase
MPDTATATAIPSPGPGTAAAASLGSSLFPEHVALSPIDDGRQRWLVWRRRGLIFAALVGCLCVFLLARWLAATPHIDASWQRGPAGQLVLGSSNSSTLHALRGHAVLALRAPGASELEVDAQLLHRAPRWQAKDDARLSRNQQLQSLAQVVSAANAAGRVELRLETGDWISAPIGPRNYAGLGLAFWPLVGLALLLYLFAAVLLWAQAQPRNLPLVVMSLLQVINLMALALDTVPGLPLSVGIAAAAADPNMPAWAAALSQAYAAWSGDLTLRVALDLCIGAAAVHAFALHPRRLPQAHGLALLAWATVPLWWLFSRHSGAAGMWWWAQGLYAALNVVSLAVIQHSHRLEANPYALVMRRFALAALLVFVWSTGVAALAAYVPALAPQEALLALAAYWLWNGLVTTLLLLSPFLARSRQLLREFAALAGISTVATSLDLLFVAVFALGPFTSLAVAVFIALALYAAVRQHLMNRLIGNSMLTTERTFDHIYRAAREVQAQPTQYTQRLAQLLRDVFEPLEVLRVERQPARTLVTGGGSALVVPIRGAADDAPPAFAMALRFARRGQRLFTPDDARLADRVVEQLRRAVAYDQAVEQGRHEERQRIAQDLHDDIGARLLTLMYQSSNPEMEDYIRHTLQDLKTLTRGLAANDHLLSHAAGEWKADLTQRLSAAQASLGWSFNHDRDVRLSMVQWSALTRVLRELVSNALFHGHASRVDVVFSLQGTHLQLAVSDNGRGRGPQNWAHGLGLGGVRKRVKALGGSVVWRELTPTGISCQVDVTDFTPRDQGGPPATSGQP